MPVIEPISADDRATMDGWYALRVRCREHDTPRLATVSRARHDNRLADAPGHASRAWAVRDGAEVVAAAEVTLPLRENRELGHALLLVAPARRRRGLGTALLRHLAAHARGAGRTRLVGQTVDDAGWVSPGGAFLRAAGARPEQHETQRRLVLPADPRALADLTAAAARGSAGYWLVGWTGPTPPRWRADLAALIARMSTDSPQGGFALDAERWDADRVRERDEQFAASGERRVVTAARAADGRLVAYTEIAVPAAGEDAVGRQDDTLVAPEHRGHRLGLRVKLANLEQLTVAHPRVGALDTWNADDNPWMIAINDALGYVPIARVTDWQLDLGADQPGTTAASSAAASAP